MIHPIDHGRPDSLWVGLGLIGQALLDGVRGLGRRSVHTAWSRLRSDQVGDCG